MRPTWFLGMGKENKRFFLELWQHSASDQELGPSGTWALLVTCSRTALVCSVSATRIWVTFWSCSMTTCKNFFFIILEIEGCISPLPYCLCSSIVPFRPFWWIPNCSWKETGDNSIFSSSYSGDWFGSCLWYCASLIIILTSEILLSVEKKACQLHHSFITEKMLLRKVLNEDIVQMPKKKKKSAMSRD